MHTRHLKHLFGNIWNISYGTFSKAKSSKRVKPPCICVLLAGLLKHIWSQHCLCSSVIIYDMYLRRSGWRWHLNWMWLINVLKFYVRFRHQMQTLSPSRNAGERNVLLFFSSDFVLLPHEFTNLSFQLGWWCRGDKGNIQGDKYVPVSKLMWEFHIKKNPLIL